MIICYRDKREATPAVCAALALALTLPVMAGCGSSAPATQSPSQNPPAQQPSTTGLTKLSTDTFTNIESQHATEVEPGEFAFGSTIVSAFQVGRVFGGGAADIGFATSTDGGTKWTSGFLPGITKVEAPANPFDRVSDPAVAYDAKHGEWLIASLPIVDTSAEITAVIVSRSTDGIQWETAPVQVTPNVVSSDKDWIACDNTPQSPFYGNCYIEWDNPADRQLIQMSTSSNGGQTWGPARMTANQAGGLGGMPVVQPNGHVVVPIQDAFGTNMLAFTSTDGGATWNAPVTISPLTDHQVAGNFRSTPLPSAATDAAGTVYVVWQDCRFRTGCSANDVVMSTSTDGATWAAPIRIQIDSITSTVDHFIPALAVDPETSGSTGHLVLTYYFYPSANCTADTCELNVGFTSSQDGGTSWSAPNTLSGPMLLASLPDTMNGLMVGDYISTVYSNGKAFSVFAVARLKSGSLFDEAIYTNTNGLTTAERAARFSSAGERPIPDAHSDHPPRQFNDLDHMYPMKPPRR
jgi:hypothetical protein